jgi:hypothetical protein
MADQEQPGHDAAGKRDFVNVAPLQLEQHLTPRLLGSRPRGKRFSFQWPQTTQLHPNKIETHNLAGHAAVFRQLRAEKTGE